VSFQTPQAATFEIDRCSDLHESWVKWTNWKSDISNTNGRNV